MNPPTHPGFMRTSLTRSVIFHKMRSLPYVLPGNKLTMQPPSDAYILKIRQGPERAKVAGPKDKGIYPSIRLHGLRDS